MPVSVMMCHMAAKSHAEKLSRQMEFYWYLKLYANANQREIQRKERGLRLSPRLAHTQDPGEEGQQQGNGLNGL